MKCQLLFISECSCCKTVNIELSITATVHLDFKNWKLVSKIYLKIYAIKYMSKTVSYNGMTKCAHWNFVSFTNKECIANYLLTESIKCEKIT